MLMWKRNLLLLMFPVVAGTIGQANDADQQAQQGGAGEPIVFSICTENGAEIQRDSKIKATIAQLPFTMQQYQANGSLCNTFNAQNGRTIQIRRRGFSSDRSAKKQFQVEFVDAAGEDAKEAMLDLPAAEEWVLNAPYVDRAYIRNALAYRLGEKLGATNGSNWFAPKLRFVELFINEDYRGVYALTEKIQRGRDRVDIPKVDFENPVDLSYILEISAMTADFKTKRKTSMEYSYPGRRKMEKWETENPAAATAFKRSLMHELNQFETMLHSKAFAHPQYGYPAYIDIPSFVDYFLVRTAFKDIDGFRRSVYFYKGRDKKIHMGPLWDFNIAFGNMRWWDMADVGGWTHGHLGFYPEEAFWFKRLMKDASFVDAVMTRYHELRAPGMPLDMAVLEEDIGELAASLGTSAARDHERWAGTYGLIENKITITKHKSDTMEGNVAILRAWLNGRLQWLDRHMPDLYKKAKRYQYNY